MSPRIPTGKRPQITRTITSFTIVACLLATAGCAEYVDEETDASGTISTSASHTPLSERISQIQCAAHQRTPRTHAA